MNFEKFMKDTEEKEKRGELGEVENIAGETPDSGEGKVFHFTAEEIEERRKKGMSDEEIEKERQQIEARINNNNDKLAA